MQSVNVQLQFDRRLGGMVWHYRYRGQRYPLHTHRELELNVVVRGCGAYLIDDRRYDLRRNSMIWLFRGQPHVLLDQSDDLETWIAVWRPGVIRLHAPVPLQRSKPAREMVRQLGEAPASRLVALLAEVEAAQHDPERFNLGMAYLLRLAWSVHQETPTLALGVEVHPAVERAARALDADPGLTLSEAAMQASLSESRLRHLFRKQAGVSLVQYRNRRRLERFLSLFGDGRRQTMLEAALAAGFGSYVQFHRIFCAAMGHSPRRWQQRRSAGDSRK